jgi:hypothetical protein
MGIGQVSFLPADVSSHAFNRQTAWAEPRQHEILPSENELPDLQLVVAQLLANTKGFYRRVYSRIAGEDTGYLPVLRCLLRAQCFSV